MKKFATGIAATTFFTLSFAFATFGHDYRLGEMEINHPYVRAMLPGAKVGAGYLKITNHGKVKDRLVSATASRAGDVQLHEMAIVNEVMKMRELENGIAIPDEGAVELKPGGLHIMFMDVKEPFKEGEKIKATLAFEKAGSIDVEFNVSTAAGKSSAHSTHQHTDATQSDAQQAIPSVLKGIFETADNRLDVAPVIASDNWAVAGWVQGQRGGRALLKRSDDGWTVYLCSGDSLKDVDALKKIGVPDDEANQIASDLAVAEGKLESRTLKLFSSFEGTVMVNGESDQHGQGHGTHKGHKK